MSQTIKNRTTGKRIEVLDGMESKPLNAAMTFWASLQTGGKKLRASWYNLGEVLRAAKTACDGNTKKFGAWREKHFKGINPSVASCAQTVAIHKARIEKWAVKNSPAINNPMTLQRLYQTATKIRLKADGTTEKIAEIEVPEVPEAGKLDGGIETLFETLRKAVNAIIKTEVDNWPDDYSVKIQTLTGSLEKWLDNEVSKSNPVDPNAEFIDPERKQAIVKEIASATQIGK